MTSSDSAHTSNSPIERSFVMQRTVGGILWLIAIVAVLVMAANPRPATPEVTSETPVINLEVTHGDSSADQPERFVANFELTERSGKTVTNTDLKGNPWVVNFIFTKCVMSCPANTKAMMELAERCEDTPVKFVTITVDPERDTPEQLKDYAEIFGADPEKWWFLTGEKEKIHSLIQDSFLQVVEEKTGENRLLGYEFAHTDRAIHIDANGRIVGQYLTTAPEEMAKLARVLHGEMETPEENIFIAPQDPAEPLPQALKIKPATEDLKPDVEVPAWVTSLPAVNAGLNGLATLLLLAGFILIKSGKRTAHRNVMLLAFCVSVLFLACYLTYHFGLRHYTGESSKSFPDLGFIRLVYLTILFSHILLAVPVPVLSLMTIRYGLRGRLEQHRFWARITFPIWLYVSVTGVIIYYMLYHLAA